MAVEVLALALWIPLALLGLWLLVTGRTIFGRPKGLKEGWQVRLFGLAYVVMPGYLFYRAIHDGSYAADGVAAGYAVLIVLAVVALYRWRKGRQVQRFT
jgi:hypothetical protein